MSDLAEYILVFITTPSFQDAETLATALLEKRLIACGNILPDIRSVFWWNDAIESAQEVLLIAKSRKSLFPMLVSTVTSLHPYEVPEILALPILLGSERYLKWLHETTQIGQG